MGVCDGGHKSDEVNWNRFKIMIILGYDPNNYYIFSKHQCMLRSSSEIQHLFIDLTTDLLAVQSGSSTKAKVGPNIALDTPMNTGYHTSWPYNSLVPPQQELVNEPTLMLSGGVLKPLHNCVVEFMGVEYVVHKCP